MVRQDIYSQEGELTMSLPVGEVSATVGAPSMDVDRRRLQEEIVDLLGEGVYRFDSEVEGVGQDCDTATAQLADGSTATGDLRQDPGHREAGTAQRVDDDDPEPGHRPDPRLGARAQPRGQAASGRRGDGDRRVEAGQPDHSSTLRARETLAAASAVISTALTTHH